MELSIILARWLGLYILIATPSIIIHRKHLQKIIDDFSGNLALIYLSGFFHLIFGVLIIVIHNVWVADWRVLITIIGWLGIIKGLTRLYIPEKLPKLIKIFTEKTLIFWCVVFTLIGLYLTYIGFSY